jgi:hypothetical protein
LIKKEFNQEFNLIHSEDGNFQLSERIAQYNAAMELYNLHTSLAGVVSLIASKQKEYTARISKIGNKKNKKIGDTYLAALELLRSELIPTKQTSMFADEKRLREEITEVYLPLCISDAGPSNLQLESIKNLTQNVEAAKKKYDQINASNEQKIKEILLKEKIN